MTVGVRTQIGPKRGFGLHSRSPGRRAGVDRPSLFPCLNVNRAQNRTSRPRARSNAELRTRMILSGVRGTMRTAARLFREEVTEAPTVSFPTARIRQLVWHQSAHGR